METKRKGVSVSLPTDIIDVLNRNAETDGRNTSRYLEAVLMDYFKIKPKPLRKPTKLTLVTKSVTISKASKKPSKAVSTPVSGGSKALTKRTPKAEPKRAK